MNHPRRSTIFLCSMTGLTLLFAAMLFHARGRQAAEMAGLERTAGLVAEAGLTDLCLFTEASYARNPTQTDLQTPFLEHPVSLEHFPSGSLMLPAEQPKDRHAEIH